MTPSEIAAFVVSSDAVSGPEGMSNRMKFHYILEVFECGGLNLNDMFDYDAAVASQDCELIQAANFLASLQWEWSTRCHLHGLVAEEEHQSVLSYLTLSKYKMAWANSFLVMGREPPPYPFVN